METTSSPKEAEEIPVTLMIPTPNASQIYDLNVTSLTIDFSDEAAIGTTIIQWIQQSVMAGRLSNCAATSATTTHTGQDVERRIIPIKPAQSRRKKIIG